MSSFPITNQWEYKELNPGILILVHVETQKVVKYYLIRNNPEKIKWDAIVRSLSIFNINKRVLTVEKMKNILRKNGWVEIVENEEDMEEEMEEATEEEF